ncbi:MAG: hypothetical protein ABI132_06030 [Rhodanobacteraceae bacterium]
MKSLSLFLILLCATGVPLTAAALDYGSSQRMLAAEAGMPTPPGARGDENPFSLPSATHRAHGDDETAAGTATASDNESHAASHTAHAAVSRPVTPAISTGPAPNARGHSVLSWQSLLPGSIQ